MPESICTSKNNLFPRIGGTNAPMDQPKISKWPSLQELSFEFISKRQLVELRAGCQLTCFVLKKKSVLHFTGYDKKGIFLRGANRCQSIRKLSRVLFVFFFPLFSLEHILGAPHGPHLCAVGFCFVSVNLFEGRVPGMAYRFLACGFGCNFPNCVVTTSSLPLRLAYVSENNNKIIINNCVMYE